MIRRAGVLLVVALLPGGLAAQALSEVDHIVAIVGRVAIPYSRVDEELNVIRGRGQTIPTDSAALARVKADIVRRLVDDELLNQEAEADTSIHITNEQVQNAVDQAIRQVRTQFRSDVDFQRQLQTSGFGSFEEYRRWVTDQRRRDLLQQTLVQKLKQHGDLRPLPPTEAEMQAFYEQVKDRQTRPAVASFRQVLIRPEPDSAALVRAFQLADSLSQALRAGGDFAALAKRFSDDPGSREVGGELGYFRRGQMVPEFEYVAFRLRPGQVSPPVHSPYGFHVIEVERSEPTEVEARHILIAPKITEANVAAARALADTIARRAREGASFDSMARLHHEPRQDAFVEGAVLDSLPQIYQEALADAQPGDIVGPVTLEQPEEGVRFVVIRLEEMRPAGSYTFEELKERIRGQLSEESGLRRYLDGLRKRVYVDIRL